MKMWIEEKKHLPIQSFQRRGRLKGKKKKICPHFKGERGWREK